MWYVQLVVASLAMILDFIKIFCPLSMTDGAARVIQLKGTPAMKQDIFPRLIR
jgi:hypothetical protein